MDKIILIFHVLTAICIVGLILLQQGKGATLGASFGSGASQTLFGSQGGHGFLAKTTAVAAVIFFTTSFSLAYISKERALIQDDLNIPGLEIPAEESEPADVPVLSTEEPEPETATENDAAETPPVLTEEPAQ